MNIDVTNYVDRWMNDYIIYHSGRLDKYGDMTKAASYFDSKFRKDVVLMNDNSKMAQVNMVVDNMRSLGKSAARALLIAEALSEGTLLDDTLDLIANSLNEGIDKYYQEIGLENYEDYLNTLQNSNLNETLKVNSFFNYLIEALYQIGKIDANTLLQLTDIGLSMVGSDFSLDKKWNRRTSKMLSLQDIDNCNGVVNMLRKAADTWGSGELTDYFFKTTIAKIFRDTIGNQIARKAIAKSLRAIDSKIDEIISSDKNFIEARGKSRTSLVLPENSGLSTVDVFNQKGFILHVREQGKEFDIEIGSNVNVNWNSGEDIFDNISIETRASVGDYFPSGTLERYLAYNAIAHRNTMTEANRAYRALRSSLAASFFNDWLSGNGRVMPKRQIDRAQFLMVNGKLYSISRIINNICQEVVNLDARYNRTFFMDIGNTRNKWVGEYTPNMQYAMIRSKAVNAVINKLVIYAKFNKDILTKYAY